MSLLPNAKIQQHKHRQNSLTFPSVPIIWDYVKWLPCNGQSPFAPPPSSRPGRLSFTRYDLHSKTFKSPPPFQGCRKLVQTISGFSQWLQSINCFFSAEKYSGSLFTSLTAHSSIPYWRKLLSQPPYFQQAVKILRFHRKWFVVYLYRLLKIPKQSIFFPPSIPLSLQPLFQAVI